MDQVLITTGACNGVGLLDLRRAHRHEVRTYVYGSLSCWSGFRKEIS